MDAVFSSAPGYASFRSQLTARRGAYCSFMLTLLLAFFGLIIFISQISRSNSKGSFYAFDNNKRFSSESYYSERIGLPQVVICPGNGVKINNVLQNIQNVECSFRSNGGKSETSMDVVKEKMVSMRMLDGTYESGIGCYSVKGSNFKVSSMYDIAYCEVFFKVPEFKGNFFAELMDLRDDQSRIYFTSNEYEFHNNRPHNPKTITDPKDMALYWHRMEPLHVTITDVDIIQLQSRNKNHNHGEYAWFQGRVVEKIPYEFVNFTANPTYFNNHPVLSFTYGYGNWFTPQLKEYKVYPPSMAMGVIFGYAYMLSLLGLFVMFMAAWFFQYDWPIWSWTSEGTPLSMKSDGPQSPQYYSSSFGQQDQHDPVKSAPPPAAPGMSGGYGAI